MTEFDYDCLQKKWIGRSARQRVGLRRTVTLPSDSLTPLELEQLNGPCRVYRLGHPMNMEEFSGMPRDLQRSYLHRLRVRGGSKRTVSRMLGISQRQLSELLQENGLQLDQPDPAAWDAFLSQKGSV